MKLLKSVLFLLSVSIIVCSIHAQDVNDQAKDKIQLIDEQVLRKYLSQEKASDELKMQIQELINKSQVFFLSYERNPSFEDKFNQKNIDGIVDSLNKKGIDAKGFLHFKGSEILATFSKFQITDYKAETKSWLEQMRVPVNAGYILKSVIIVYQPSIEIQKKVFEKSKEVLSLIDMEIEKNKSEYKQFTEYNKRKISSGKWAGRNWFNSLSYQYGYGKIIPHTKGGYEKTTEYWCSFSIVIEPIKGGTPQSLRKNIKSYPKLAIESFWAVGSDNKEFNERLSDIFKKALSILDEYEKELENDEAHNQVEPKKSQEESQN